VSVWGAEIDSRTISDPVSPKSPGFLDRHLPYQRQRKRLKFLRQPRLRLPRRRARCKLLARLGIVSRRASTRSPIPTGTR